MTLKEDDRRQQILDAAQAVFAAKNFQATTIKDIARAAGISPGLIYWYFKDKTDLFTSLLSERISSGLEEVAGLALADMRPEQFLHNFARFYIGMYERPQNLALFKMVVANTVSLPAVVRQLQSRVVAGVLGTVQAYLEQQVALGRMRPCDTEMVARAFIGSLLAYVVSRHILKDPLAQQVPQDRLVEGVVDVVLHGILPPNPQRQGAEV